jgi:hypothetical protein
MVLQRRQRDNMKLLLNLSLILFAFFSLSNKSMSLTDYQIKRHCTKEKKVFSCVKDLQEKRSNLKKGKFIEIPVVPYKR